METSHDRPNENRFSVDELIELFGYDTVLKQTLDAIEQHESWLDDYEKNEIEPIREKIEIAKKIGDVNMVYFWKRVTDVVLKGVEKYQDRARWLEKSKRDLGILQGDTDDSRGTTDAQTIKEETDLKQVVLSYGVKLRKAGLMKWRAPCPFHGEKDPSFFVYEDRGGWYCYGCHAGGSVIDFVMQADSIDFKSACQMLSRL